MTSRAQLPKLHTDALVPRQLFLENDKAIAYTGSHIVTRTEYKFEVTKNEMCKPFSLEQGDQKPNTQPNRHRSYYFHDRHHSVDTDQHPRSTFRNRSHEYNLLTASRLSRVFVIDDKRYSSWHNIRQMDGSITIEKDRYVQPPRFRTDPRERYYPVDDLTIPTRSYPTTPILSTKRLTFIDQQGYIAPTTASTPPPETPDDSKFYDFSDGRVKV